MKRPVQAENVISRLIGDEIVLIKDNGGATHVLNKTAAVIWEMCDGQRSIDEIGAGLSERFDVSPEVAQEDTRELIDKLVRAGVLSLCQEAAAGKEEQSCG